MTFDAQEDRRSAIARAVPDSAEDDLTDAVAGLAMLLSETGGLSILLGRIASFAATAIPNVDVAGVSLLRDKPGAPQLQTWATQSDIVQEIDRIQYDLLDEGPCVTCMRTLRPAVSGSLGSDTRWPRFGGRVARLNVHSGLSLPLLVDGVAVGAINCYAYERDSFGASAVRSGELFAAPAAVAARNARLLDTMVTRAAQLERALPARATIDQAIGILMSRAGGSPERAFDRLVQISQRENVKLALVARRIVDEAVRRAHARSSGGE